MADKTFKIEGMSCQHCVMAVKKAVDGINGVSNSDVSVGNAKIDYDTSKTSEGTTADIIRATAATKLLDS